MPQNRIDLEGGMGSRSFPSPTKSAKRIDIEGNTGAFDTAEQPKQSFLRRIFGDPISNSTEQQMPGIRAAWSGRQIERPDLEGQVSNIRPMNMFTKWMNPDAYAKTNMFGGVELNKELIDKDKQDINDVLIHEMTHAGQGMGGFMRKMYNPSPDENAAIDAESMRNVRREDIPLRGNEIDSSRQIPTTKINMSEGSKEPEQKGIFRRMYDALNNPNMLNSMTGVTGRLQPQMNTIDWSKAVGQLKSK